MEEKFRKYSVCVIFMFLLCVMMAGFFESDITLNILQGRETSFTLNSLFPGYTITQESENISVNGELSSSYEVGSEKNLKILSKNKGKFTLTVNILGGIPIKEVTVNVLPNIRLYAGGDIVGVKMDTAGVIVVGFEGIMTGSGEDISPAQSAGLRVGDVVLSVNSVPVNSAEEFRKVLNEADDNYIIIEADRSGETIEFNFSPVTSAADGVKRAGIWVRDNVAGIGTITCVTEELDAYAALGHAVTDISTGINVPVSDGYLSGLKILSINKGEKNNPGEIKGIFADETTEFGTIETNDDFGIYGKYISGAETDEKFLYPVATQDMIEEGPAQLITDIGGSKKAYDIVIEKKTAQSVRSTKSMLIRITDDSLIELTGGIVQGMSGSPIIQNGRIVGALTHVMVSDPLKGYAVYVEWMLQDLIDCQN